MKINKMRESLGILIESVHPRVYFEDAPDTAQYPYIVVDIANSTDDGTLEQFFVDVDGWDSPANGDTTALEEMMAAVDGALHRKTVYEDGNICMTLYRESRNNLRDPDRRIRRRKYVYQARTF